MQSDASLLLYNFLLHWFLRTKVNFALYTTIKRTDTKYFIQPTYNCYTNFTKYELTIYFHIGVYFTEVCFNDARSIYTFFPNYFCLLRHLTTSIKIQHQSFAISLIIVSHVSKFPIPRFIFTTLYLTVCCFKLPWI